MDLEPRQKKYAIWYEKQYPGFAKRLKEKTTHFALHPKFSIIVPLYHTPLAFFRRYDSKCTKADLRKLGSCALQMEAQRMKNLMRRCVNI